MLSFLEEAMRPDSIADKDTLIKSAYPRNEWSFGAEHEWGDARLGTPLPEGNAWNDKDYTCVATCGVANDPRNEFYPFSGEINTVPTRTVEEQGAVLTSLIEALKRGGSPDPVVNYRSNLHFHVRVPGLREDLGALRRILRYHERWIDDTYRLVEPIPHPTAEEFPDPERLAWARKRERRRYKSHQNRFPQDRVKEMLSPEVTTPWEFRIAHYPWGGNPLRRLQYAYSRTGINIYQLWEPSETIEFRHWPGTLDPSQINDALEWCARWLDAALNHPDDESPEDIWASRAGWNLPSFPAYDYAAERVYTWTKCQSWRKEVAPRIAALKRAMPELWLDPCARTSEEVWATVQELVAQDPSLALPSDDKEDQ
jgi:hypothetical protein